MPDSTPAPDIHELAAVITGRSHSAFASSWSAAEPQLATALEGRRIVLVGGAGFIARHTLRELLRYQPAQVTLLDIDENGLAEVVRSLRSAQLLPAGTGLATVLVDVTGPHVGRAIAQGGQPDRVMLFSAVKHVRAERDDTSTLRMFEVNVIGARAVAEAVPDAPVFAVSTDKAVMPTSLMGASKNLMEQVLLSGHGSVSLARFANVAMSAGSLLDSWRRRLDERLPLAVPADTWRYFVTPQEAGQLCLLASIAPEGHVMVPAPELIAPVLLEDAAASFLAAHDRRARFVDSIEKRVGPDEYPVVVTPRDTAGEKRLEQFTEPNAAVHPWLSDLHLVRREVHADRVEAVIEWLSGLAPTSPVRGPHLDALIEAAVPGFEHVAGPSLDDRM